MLVLSRQRDESIIIDLSSASDDELARLRSGEEVIEITVVDIRGDKVRIGTAAANSIAIHRKEIWDRIRKQNRTVSPK